ncbi:cytochrome c oxidase subunit I [Pasteuria penetrans]|uniref:cytochrome c oxidase subunit I n=1 Tax=Pasteuria penetrans TaxID=86005 RepID=UPI001FE371EE|nr:cytochrome c oxidase subunit I [Pasteuria penetrans]
MSGGYNRGFLVRIGNSRVWQWVTTVDHKKIGILYFLSGFFFLLVGGLEAMLMRLQLSFPGLNIFVGDTFNQLLTMHGTTMIFLAAMPLLLGFMNYMVPLQIGARDVAFPFVNALGFWLFLSGGILLNLGWFFGGSLAHGIPLPSAGWTSYVPLALNEYSPGPGVDYYLIGLQISGIGTLVGGLNIIATVISLRAPGMTFLRMPLFTWTSFIASVLILFAFPALTVGLLLLTFDRLFGANFFDHAMGGSSVLWQHLFWIFGHPEVYIVILPAFGLMSDIFSNFSKKRLFGYTSMVFASLVIGFLGFMVWVHHMFTVGLGPFTNTVFSIATMAIAVPTGIKVFNWLFTMWGGQIRRTTSMLFAISFIPTFVIGGMTGVMLSLPGVDFQVHDTYFVIAHFHYTLVGGTVLGIFAGAYYWWPKMFNRILDERLGNWHFWLFTIGLHVTFFPQHFLGLFGMQRRVFTYYDVGDQGLATMNLVSSIASLGMAVGTLLFAWNIYRSWRKGPRAVADPWDGRTLEWSVAAPVPEYNFLQLPRVRDVDPLWKEKQMGNTAMLPAEPLGPIHMPSPNYLPFLMSVFFFVAGLGFISSNSYGDDIGWAGLSLGIFGLLGVVVCLFLRSFQKDPGYHMDPGSVGKGEQG